MAGEFDQPSSTDLIEGGGQATLTFANWITRIHVICSALRQSGTTANRPTSGLWIGRQFYDTTLLQPVYVSSVKPTVWRDAAGAVV
jgi:hypothetical protein